MLTCKQVSRALAEQDYKEFSIFKRIGLRLHVAVCLVCKGYNGNVMLFQDMARAFRRFEESSSGTEVPHKTRAKWQNVIDDATHKTEN
jgi:hypothetical protein